MIARGRGDPESLLVGRQRELRALWGHVEAAADGRAGVMLVAGEPGIGKTHLLDVIAVRAAREDRYPARRRLRRRGDAALPAVPRVN